MEAKRSSLITWVVKGWGTDFLHSVWAVAFQTLWGLLVKTIHLGPAELSNLLPVEQWACCAFLTSEEKSWETAEAAVVGSWDKG